METGHDAIAVGAETGAECKTAVVLAGHTCQLLPALGVPYSRRMIPGRRHDPRAIGAESDALDRLLLALLQQLVTGFGVPQPPCVVIGPRRDPRSTRTENGAPNRFGVALELGALRPGLGVPHPHTTVIGCRHDTMRAPSGLNVAPKTSAE